MTVNLHILIEALRNELQQYGEMLALLDNQPQELAVQRAGEAVTESSAAIQAQSATIQAARQRRQGVQQELARTLQQPEDASLTGLIPLFPEQYRPLISALVQENNELLQRVGQRARQNQHLLQQSLELMQNFIATLSTPDLTGRPGQGDASVLDAAPNPACSDVAA